MLEPILKGLVEWLYQIMVDIMAYASGELIGVMSMDLSYFEKTAPVISDIVNVFVALGWALLLGNLVFQLIKSMASGIGFEAEDPKFLFFRTFVFSFLLLSSRQICNIGLSITGTVIDLLSVPSSINVRTPDESMFSLGADAKWLLVIVVGVVLMVQMVKLLFEIGERYVITSVLTFFAPLAFSMGGSKNTNDIFKGWVRMYCSMLVMMIMNIVFLKLIMSAMSQMTSGGVLIWLVFVVALTRVARKIDSHIGKIGLNPAQTGSAISSRLPGMMTMMAVRVMSSTVSRSLAGGKGSSGKNGASSQSRAGRRTNRRSSHFSGGYSNTSNHNGNNSFNSTNEINSYMQARQGAKGSNSTCSEQTATVDRINSNLTGKTTAPPLSRNTTNSTAVHKPSANSGNKGSSQRNNANIGITENHKTGTERSTSSNMRTDIHNGGINANEHMQENASHAVNSANYTAKGYDNNSKTVVRSNETGNIHTNNIESRTSSHTESLKHNEENIHSKESSFEYGKRTVETEHKVNHEYKHGKYNPAARNKKAKTDFYSKGNKRYLKEDDNNGKHKW